MTESLPQDQAKDQRPPPANDFGALPAGRRIGRYEILAVLGRGGFGITYRARDTQLGREVAIKEYLPSALALRQADGSVLPQSTALAADFTWGRERFVEEGRTLATLQHAPAIVQVFDFLEENGTAYIVMKLMPGRTLEERLGAGPLSPAELERILWPLLDGLEQVHATGFLHRDIKPANILLDGEGNPTLIDFGASRAAMAGRTVAMTAVFTPGYAAAEQFSSAKQGPWTDIYGLAATLHHAIAGMAPPSAFDRLLDDRCQPLARSKPPGFQPALLAGIDCGLAVRAEDRPPSIAAWRTMLAGAAPTVLMRKPGTAAPDSAATRAMRRGETAAEEARPARPDRSGRRARITGIVAAAKARSARRRIILLIVAAIALGPVAWRYLERHGLVGAASVPGPSVSPDGHWRGALKCSGNAAASEFTIMLDITIADGFGKWLRPDGAKSRNQSVEITVRGGSAVVARSFEPANYPGTTQVATMAAHFDGARITGAGEEKNSGGRTCELNLVRAAD